MAYDDLLQQVEGKPFLRRLYVLFFLNGFPNSLAVTSLALMFFVPNDYHCALPDMVESSNMQNTTLDFFIPYDDEKQEYSKCSIYNRSEEEISDFIHSNFTLSEFEIGNVNLSTTSCKGKYIFKGENRKTTIPMEFNHLCENAWIKPTLMLPYFIGKLALSISGFLSDKYGRRPVFISFTFLSFITMFVLSFAQSTWMIGVMLAVGGLSSLVNFLTGFVLGAECTTPGNRNFMTILSFVSYGLGYTLSSTVGYLTPDWRWMLRVSGLIGVLYIANIWFVPESPRWLMSTGRIDEAKKLFKSIATYNKLNLSKDFFHEVDKEAENLLHEKKNANNKKKGMWSIMKGILKTPKLVLIMTTLVYSWFSINLIYFGMSLNIQALSGNLYLNNMSIGLVEIPGVILTFVAMKYLSRPVAHGGSVIFCGLFCLAAAFLNEVSPYAASFAALAGKAVISGSFYLVYIHTAEVFPTVVRNSYIGILSSAGRLGSFFSPYIILLSDLYGMYVTYIIMTSITVSSGLATLLFSPDTNNIKLPETIADVLKMKSIVSGCSPTKKSRKLNEEELLTTKVVSAAV